MSAFTLRIDRLRDTKKIPVSEVQETVAAKVADTELQKQVSKFNTQARKHNAEAAAFVAVRAELDNGTITGDPFALARDLPQTHIKLRVTCLELLAERKRLCEALLSAWNAQVLTWQKAFELRKRQVNEQMLAVAGGSQSLADKLVDVTSSLTELRADAYRTAPDWLYEKHGERILEARYAVAIAVSDAANLTDDNAWPKTIPFDYD